MQPTKPPAESLPRFIPASRGEPLTPEQYRRVFAGSQQFVQVLASLTQHPTPDAEPTQESA